jgi:hypothetical protein
MQRQLYCCRDGTPGRTSQRESQGSRILEGKIQVCSSRGGFQAEGQSTCTNRGQLGAGEKIQIGHGLGERGLVGATGEAGSQGARETLAEHPGPYLPGQRRP